MANFDTSTIENFDTMTAEEKLDALLKADIPEQVDMSKYILKDQFDKKVSDLNSQNKKLKDQMNAEQQKKVEEDEAKAAEAQKFADLENKYNELLKNSTLKEHTISLTGLGFDEKLAGETATAIVEGDSTKLFANMKKFLENYRKAIEKELMDKTPGPGGNAGKTDDKNTAVEFAKSLYGKEQAKSQSFNDILNRYKK
jgi:hypothetical protein